MKLTSPMDRQRLISVGIGSFLLASGFLLAVNLHAQEGPPPGPPPASESNPLIEIAEEVRVAPPIEPEPPPRPKGPQPAAIGYARPERIANRANVPGETGTAQRENLRGFFTTRYPVMARDPIGLEVLIGELGLLASQNFGRIEAFLFNGYVDRYVRYTHFAALLDDPAIDAQLNASYRRWFALQVIRESNRRLTLDEARRIVARAKTSPILEVTAPEDLPEDLLQRHFPSWRNLDGSQRVRVIDSLRQFNPWLGAEPRISADDPLIAMILFEDRSRILFEEGGEEWVANYYLIPGEVIAIPSEAYLNAAARGSRLPPIPPEAVQLWVGEESAEEILQAIEEAPLTIINTRPPKGVGESFSRQPPGPRRVSAEELAQRQPGMTPDLVIPAVRQPLPTTLAGARDPNFVPTPPTPGSTPGTSQPPARAVRPAPPPDDRPPSREMGPPEPGR